MTDTVNLARHAVVDKGGGQGWGGCGGRAREDRCQRAASFSSSAALAASCARRPGCRLPLGARILHAHILHLYQRYMPISMYQLRQAPRLQARLRTRHLSQLTLRQNTQRF